MINCDNFFLGFFFFNDTATTEIYSLSLHDALPISLRVRRRAQRHGRVRQPGVAGCVGRRRAVAAYCCERAMRSEEHTSELQSLTNLVCPLLLEKKRTLHVSYPTLDAKRNSSISVCT